MRLFIIFWSSIFFNYAKRYNFNFVDINSIFMGRSNKTIDKLMVKMIFEDNIKIPLPKVFVENRLFSLFSIISPTYFDFCSTELNVNSHYTSFILTSYGTITRNTTYWICPDCKKSFHDQIVGVTGSANYSDEFYDKQTVFPNCKMGRILAIDEGDISVWINNW